MIYGYLRVSSDEQDVNSQKQGVDTFAKEKGWKIDQYITDEGISGGKDPDKRKLGPLLKKVQKDDIIISSEISRLGRDLFMVMDILHFCMERECIIYTVKDRFVLGDDIQSKVLAFAFGLSAEIERQMIRQRTKEGLRLKMKKGVLLGRPIGVKTRTELLKCEQEKERILEQYKWGVPQRRIAQNFDIDRNTLARYLLKWGAFGDCKSTEARRAKELEQKRRQRVRNQSYKDEPFKVVDIDREKVVSLIQQDKTIPEIAERFPEYTYEQVYDTINCDEEFNPMYRIHGQIIAMKR